MALPNTDQYIRVLALEAAVRLIAGESDLPLRDMDYILSLADKFAEYIREGQES